jgi:hypothetical protein
MNWVEGSLQSSSKWKLEPGARKIWQLIPHAIMGASSGNQERVREEYGTVLRASDQLDEETVMIPRPSPDQNLRFLRFR